MNSATDFFRQGNTAYEQGKFEEAAGDYQQAADLGISDARLYYNYGNALYRLNRLGPAILYYERARKLAPGDEDVAFNLRFARAHVQDKIAEPESNLLTRFLWNLHSGYSTRAGLWMAWILFALIFAGLATARFLGALGRGAALAASGVCAFALLCLAPSLIYKIRQLETVQYGVVLQPTVEMFSGPGENYQILSRVHEGTEFEIVERHGEWLSVKLLDGKGGYVRANQLGKV